MFAIAEILCPILIVGVVFTLIIVGGREVKKQLTASLEQLAPKVQGEVRPGNWATHPSLVFTYLGAGGRLEFNATGGKHKTYYTDIFIGLRGLPVYAFHVAPEGFFSKVGKFLGGQDIEIGDRAFDEAFVIKGEPEEFVFDVLTPEVREAIFGLQKMRNQAIDIRVVHDQLRFRKLSWIKDVEGLSGYLDLAEVVFRRYLEVVASNA